MALNRKYERKHTDVLRDTRPNYIRLAEWCARPSHAFCLFLCGCYLMCFTEWGTKYSDFILFSFTLMFLWLRKRDRGLPYKLPMGSKFKDVHNKGPGLSGKGEGILFLGNHKDTREEAWFTNSDARTHILYLGTTGAGKTEGLKSIVTNALSWGSGFIYVDGKADTDLWSSLSALVRRFGRDDDLLVLNYMTGNSANSRAPSNTMNPFSSGSASYLTNMMVSLMPDSGGDNAMWKDRAVSLLASLMPALVWRRENLDVPMSISSIRNYLNLNMIIKLSRDEVLPNEYRAGLKGYLDTLPGYIDNAFDNEGKEKPPGPDTPQYDTTTPRQQHGYLSMQFTRSLQSLGDEYGYIFDTQAADVDMNDVVLNRRMLIVLIPALEKSEDETANLGKIVSASLKGMMGGTLGSTVEGDSAAVIDNKPTRSATPFMTVFDEVGYYTAAGMAVMAAQARSLGFCLIYSAQDLPAMEKRVKEEARSITANCNIKIFGKLEDPTQTKEFFEKTVGQAMVMESSGFQLQGGRSTGGYFDNQSASLQIRGKASYDGLKGLKSGEAVVAFGEYVTDISIFYSNPGFAKAMRVSRFVSLPPPDDNVIKNAGTIAKVRDLLVHKTWTAAKAIAKADTPPEIRAIEDIFARTIKSGRAPLEAGKAAIVAVLNLSNPVDLDASSETQGGSSGGPAAPQLSAQRPAAAPPPDAAPLTATPRAPIPAKPAETTAAAPQSSKPVAPPTAPPAQAPAVASGNPMSFFGKKNAPQTSESPPAAETPAGAAPAPSTLDPESRAVIEKAGRDASQTLFGRQTDSVDGAE